MKIAIINGSPRKGNTLTAINAVIQGLEDRHEIDIIEADKLNISPCKGCDACECYKGCVAKDDTNETIDRIASADLILFASPVYWWGITAQAKLVMDKCYSKGAALKGKKAGVIIVGGSPVDNPQYAIIKTQFECIAEFLDWDILFHQSYFAMDTGDLAGNETALAELRAIGKSL